MSEPLLGEAADLAPGPAPSSADAGDASYDQTDGGADEAGAGGLNRNRRRRRGSRGGRSRRGTAQAGMSQDDDEPGAEPVPEEQGRRPGTPAPVPASTAPPVRAKGPARPASHDEAPSEGPEAGGDEAGEARRPRIGDTRPGSPPVVNKRRTRRTDEAVKAQDEPSEGPGAAATGGQERLEATSGEGRPRRPRRKRQSGTGPSDAGPVQPVEAILLDKRPPEVASPAPTGGRAGRRAALDKRSRALGRYLMVVHVGPTATQIAVLEGRSLIEHYVSRPTDDTTQIDGNIYLGRVQNVLPGMEAAFVDIGTPKNAVLYRGDLRYDDDEVGPAAEDASKPTRGRLGGAARDARIEQLLRTGQNIICQVTKNPIGTKGARLTQEVSLPGRFVVLIPNSDTYGISKRLADDERKRLRKILDEIRPAGHGLIVRTAAEGASADELGRDVARLLRQWEQVQQLASTSRAPQLLYREPDLAVRVIREEFNRDYRGVVIDDPRLYDQVKEYVSSITPELADRVELVSPASEALPLFERFRVHEQVHKALDRKVWLPSGGSLIIERNEALTVIDVNTGKNVGTSNLEETVFRNNLEAAEEIARQLRLRDIGGIIVIDFIDMEVMANRAEVIRTFREALARDKTRSQVFDISELGLVEMTRKRISEGLVESYSQTCPTCGGRGIVFDESLL